MAENRTITVYKGRTCGVTTVTATYPEVHAGEMDPRHLPVDGLFSTADLTNSWVYRMWEQAAERRRTRPVGDFGDRLRGISIGYGIWKQPARPAESVSDAYHAAPSKAWVVDEPADRAGFDVDRVKEACASLHPFATMLMSVPTVTASFSMILAEALDRETRAARESAAKEVADTLPELTEASNRAAKTMAGWGMIAAEALRIVEADDSRPIAVPEPPPHPFDRSQPRGRRGRRKH